MTYHRLDCDCRSCEAIRRVDEARTDEQADTDDFLAALIAAGAPTDLPDELAGQR